MLAVHNYSPHYLLVSLGLDTGAGDPVGGFALTTGGFGRVGKMIAAAGLPTAIIQEGATKWTNLPNGYWPFYQHGIDHDSIDCS